MKSWRFLGLAVVLTCNVASGQDNYRVSLTPAQVTFYCGIVNDCLFNIEDTATPRRVLKFQAVSDGAQLDYDDQGRLSVLPTSKKFTIRIYGVQNKKVFYIGKIPSTCIDPPLEDGNFKLVVPHPQKSLKKSRKFSVQGKLVEEDPALTIAFSAGMVSQLKEGEETLVAVRVSQPKGEYNVTIPWKDCEIRSADAEIREEEKQVVGITPKPGVKKCHFEIFVKGIMVGTEQLRVVGK